MQVLSRRGIPCAQAQGIFVNCELERGRECVLLGSVPILYGYLVSAEFVIQILHTESVLASGAERSGGPSQGALSL
jgi:hypothetical protein